MKLPGKMLKPCSIQTQPTSSIGPQRMVASTLTITASTFMSPPLLPHPFLCRRRFAGRGRLPWGRSLDQFDHIAVRILGQADDGAAQAFDRRRLAGDFQAIGADAIG